jgi:hypothetical protein
MPAKTRKKAAPGGTRRLPAGKDQMLSILPTSLIKKTKIAAIEDGLKLSRVVEEALDDWLAKRRTRKPTD